MSKTTLRKELAAMSHEQLQEMILDAYQASSEFKEYFEFFLNPDVRRLHEKYMKTVNKELMRVKWGYLKARVTIIKRAVKSFMGFKAGAEADIAFMTDVLRHLCVSARYFNTSDAHENYAAFLTGQLLDYGNANMMASEVLSKINALATEPSVPKYMRHIVEDTIEERLEATETLHK